MSTDTTPNSVSDLSNVVECYADGEVKIEQDKTGEDPYLYLQRNEFTSEIYKIELGGLKKVFGYTELKRFLNNKLKLKAHKIKPHFDNHVAFVNFKCEDDRQNALKVLEGYEWKGGKLTAKTASPSVDPLINKRKQVQSSVPDNKKKKPNPEHNLKDIDTQMKDSVMPLWDLPYEEQVKKKEKIVATILKEIARLIRRSHSTLVPWLKQNMTEFGGQCCELQQMLPSPVTTGYRNKNELTIGYSCSDRSKNNRKVGFRLGSYSEGSVAVADGSECALLPDMTKLVVKAFAEFVQNSDKEPYCHESHSGFWKQITVRNTSLGHTMLIVGLHPQSLTPEDLEQIKKEIAEFFQAKQLNLTSLYILPMARNVGDQTDYNSDLMVGQKHIEEKIGELTFRISPGAFFQVNTLGASVLYDTIESLARLGPEDILLDICCGTGTIGLYLAKKVKKVIGIEMVAQAVEDANHNKNFNGITNAEFVCGKAEDALFPVLYRELPNIKADASGSEQTFSAVAIVDPPRAGLHTKVLRAIRSNWHIKRLVYISCDANAAKNNFLDLCRPTSNTYKGDSFRIVTAIPVDMFPQTNHYELVLLFER